MKRLLILALIVFPLLAQQTPPPPGTPRETKVPQPVEKTLANGLRVIVVPKPGLPLVAARLMIKTGAAADPKGRDGLAQLTATVLTKGTKTRTAEEIARGVEALGATMTADAAWDFTAIDVSVMSANLAKSLEYVADVSRNATFKGDELDRERARILDSLQVTLEEPASVAAIVASRLVYGDAPYAHNLAGLPATLQKIGRSDLVTFHRAYYRPNNAVLVFAGDVTAEDAFALAQKLFGGWARGAAGFSLPASGGLKPAAPRVVVIDMPEAGNTAVVIAGRGIRRSDPDFSKAIVANMVLGGGYSSRLNQEVRIKRGLSYGANSAFEPRADVGPFTATAQTKHESAPELAQLMRSELDRLATTDVPETELVPRKAAVIGGFAFSLETTAGIVNRMAALALYGQPLSEINQYVPKMQAVTPEEVRKFAGSHLASKDFSVILAGNAKEFLEPLQKQFSDVEVISIADLDLSSPTLRVRKKKG
ncbi:MAG TPA: pitrilysin family protein [Thermoanaerobaculia bacterium]|nr:pitrilysin family protein [Thermoanaerobaculia bacterium]